MSFVLPLLVGTAAVAYAAALALPKLVSGTEGLQLVHEDDEPEIDIVLVHGLGGHHYDTWTSQSEASNINWTKHLLPHDINDPKTTCKQIRVLSYGYSPNLLSASKYGISSSPIDARFLQYLPQALYLHSNRLMEQLADSRAHGAEIRPIIFIAHSLGGLIVKNALVHASAAVGETDARLKAIELLTIGVLFFGTPHREMLWKKWSNVLDKMFQIAKILPENMKLQPLADQAQRLNLQIERYKSIETNFPNFSFFEIAKGRKGPLKAEVVIDSDMATPEIVKATTWEKIPFQRSHQNLVKFESSEDPDYRKVIDRIFKCLQPRNIQNAVARHSKFFSPIDPIGRSQQDLSNSKSIIATHWPESKLSLSRVNSSDSKEDIEKKTEINRGLMVQSERQNGLLDQTTLSAVKYLANNSVEAQDYDTADALYKRLFVANQEAFSPGSAEVAAALKGVAEVAIRQGRLIEATKDLHQVREIQIKLGLQDDEETVKVTEQIASVYVSRGLHDDALEEYAEVINHLHRARGQDDEETLRVMQIESNIWQIKATGDKRAAVTAMAKETRILQLRVEKARREAASSSSSNPASASGDLDLTLSSVNETK